jgi:hypothetical protein
MTKPKEAFNYYNIDCGFIPAPVKLAFSDEVFAEILKDHNINTKEKALELGMAEVHQFTEGKNTLIVMVFNLEECVTADPSLLVSTICHEAVHCAHRVMEYAGDDKADWGEETFCYLADSIARQVYVGIQIEVMKRARKTNRGLPKQKGKAGGGSVVQVDIEHNRGTGQVGDIKPAGIFYRAEDGERDIKSPPDSGI